ncbi:MAG: AbrB/MazE/SpoVT family DNA-binding domain-containing protein [Candidatus Woesearchaeota archaeon]|nr:AbrB/MazE/SpoVT family DNA-binding domain-containing protein [Candidatus Woesearchaeota archaeon]
MGIAKITRNWQVTIPKDVRELKGLEEGGSVIFAIEGDRVDILKLNKDVINAAAGLWTTTKETGVEYENRMRKTWEPRRKREFQ